MATSISAVCKGDSGLEAYPALQLSLHDVPDFLPLAATQGRRGYLFPYGVAKHLYDHTTVETLQDGTEVCCIGLVHRFDGEQHLGCFNAVERRSDKKVFLLNDAEFEALRQPSEVARVAADSSAWVDAQNAAWRSGQF